MLMERGSSCGVSLRTKCLTIGYLCLKDVKPIRVFYIMTLLKIVVQTMFLVLYIYYKFLLGLKVHTHVETCALQFASLVDIIAHILVVSIMTYGFECEITKESIQLINWSLLEPFLLIINLGTHGFYPYPLILRPYAEAFDEVPLGLERKCYPGMLHVYTADVLNFLINIIWFKVVFAYIFAMYKKDVKPIRVFYMMTLLKIVVQTVFLAFQPGGIYFSSDAIYFIEGSGIFKMADIVLGCFFVIIVRSYSIQITQERLALLVNQPPTYEECLNNPKQEEKKEAIINIDTKPEVPPPSITAPST